MTSSINQNHQSWSPVANPTELPNVSGSATQNSNLAVGDTCHSISNNTTYTCSTATLGSAVWESQPRKINSIYTSDYNDLTTAVAALSVGKTLVIDEDTTLSAHTVTTNQAVITNKAVVTLGNYNLTIKKLEAGRNQVFNCSGSGVVTFSANPPDGVYPEWWGATADGSVATQDEITSAYESIESIGGVVSLGIGTYGFDNYVLLSSNSNLTFKGASKEKTILKQLDTESSDCFLIANSSNITIRDLTIDMNKSGAGAGNTHGIQIWSNTTVGNDRILIENVTIKDGLYQGILCNCTTGGSVSRPLNAIVRNCEIDSCDNVGFYANGGSGNTTPITVEAYGTKVHDSGSHNFFFIRTTQSKVVDCEAYDSAAGNGIHFQTSDEFEIRGNHCHGNTKSGAYFGHGINCSEDTTDFTISDNRCTDNDNAGIILDPTEVGDGSYDTHETRGTIIGNICKGNSGSNGIYINHASHVVVSSNVVDSSANGIGVLSDNVTITDNITTNNTNYGVALFSPASAGTGHTGCKVSGNQFIGNGIKGFYNEHISAVYNDIYIFTYDFTVLGGNASTINLGTLPKEATVTHGWYDVRTAPTSDGSATIAFGIETDDATGLKGITAFDHADYGTGYHDLAPDGTAANFTTKTTDEQNVIMTIGTADLTGGRIDLFLKIVVSADNVV